MSVSFRCLLLLFLLLAQYSCKNSDTIDEETTCNKDTISSPKLVTATQAKSLLDSNHHFIPIEVSKVSEYQSGHLPRAVNVWRPDFRSKVFTDYKGMICNPSEFESFLQSLGIDDQSQLLLYDNKGGCDAMRLSWVFDYYQFKNYRVINGGKETWKRSGYLLDTLSTATSPNLNFTFKKNIEKSFLASLDDVASSLSDPNTIIVDTREDYEYLGKPFISGDEVHSYKKGAAIRGSIPGAIHLNWSDLSDLADDHRIKCSKDLKYNLAQKGITKDKNVIVYCQSGSRSSHTAFVLRELLGFPLVKNYDGSWIEWSYFHQKDKSVPIQQHTSEKEFEEIKVKLIAKIRS